MQSLPYGPILKETPVSQSSVFRRHSSAPHPEIIRGEGVYLYDSEGRRYIDASGGALVVSVGHGVAEIADAAREQTGRLAYVHGSEFTSPTVEALAREMARRAPMEDARLFLVSGGSEATETAIKLARAVHVARGDRGRYKVVFRWPSYHGASLGALAVSGRPIMRGPFAPMLASLPARARALPVPLRAQGLRRAVLAGLRRRARRYDTA